MHEKELKAVLLIGLDDTKIKAFQDHVLAYYRKNRRDLPWRDTADAYHILVSEIMLQQTQVSRVIQKFNEFIGLFPTVQALADAAVSELLSVWKGLGYNRRALNLQKAAQMIVTDYGGTVPSDVKDLMKLPGIGTYTASAVAAFAFDAPSVVIETNIRAVYIFFFFGSEAEKVSDKDLVLLIERTLYKPSPSEWYNALMDYGTYIKERYDNPAKKSRHHSIQSPFKGSNREIRGKVLKLLLEEDLDLDGLYTMIGSEKDRVAAAVSDLHAEGFIVKESGRYTIR